MSIINVYVKKDRFSGLRRWNFNEYKSKSGRSIIEEPDYDSIRNLWLRSGIQ